MERSPEQLTGGKVSMSLTIEQITLALGEANIQLRNLEVTTNGMNLRVSDAKELDDYLSLMVTMATRLHTKCREAIVKDATSTLMKEGYEVKVPQQLATPNQINPAIALLVQNGYKVTDGQGRNY